MGDRENNCPSLTGDCHPPTWDMVEEMAIVKCLGLDDAYTSLPVRPKKGYCKVDSNVMSKVMKNPSGGPNAICNFYDQDCTLTKWSPWTSCTVPRCTYKNDGGHKTRSRQVKEPAKGLGRPCSVFQKTQTLPCNTTKNLSRYLGQSNFQLGTLLSPTQFVWFEKNIYAQLPSIHPIHGSVELHRVKPVKTLQLTQTMKKNDPVGGSSPMHGFTFEALVFIPSSPSQNLQKVTLWAHQTTNNDSPGFIYIENLGHSSSNVSIKFSSPVIKDSATSFESLKYPSKLKILEKGKHASSKNVSPPKLADVVQPDQWFHLVCRADSNPSASTTTTEDASSSDPYLQVFINGHATAKQTISGSTAITPKTKGRHFIGMDMKADGTPIGSNVTHNQNAPQFTMYNLRVWGVARSSNEIQNEVGLYMDAHSFTADGLSNDVDMAIPATVNPNKLQGDDLIVDTAHKEKVSFYQVKSSSKKRVHIQYPSLTDAPSKDTQTVTNLVNKYSSRTQKKPPPHEPATGQDKQGTKHTAKLPDTIFPYLTTYVHVHDCNPVDCQWECPQGDGSKGTPIGGCSQSCGGGVQLRKCKITQYPSSGGKPCPTRSQDYYQYVPCNMQSCEDCILESREQFMKRCKHNYSCWTACNAPCNGTQYGYRRINQHAKPPNGKPCSQFDRRVSRPCCPNCNCKVCPVGPNGDACSHRGQCIKSDNQSMGYCVCQEGYAGVNCAIQCPRGWNGHVCSGQGTCTTSMSPRNFYSNDNHIPAAILLFDPSSSSNETKSSMHIIPDYTSVEVARRLFHCVPTDSSSSSSSLSTKFSSMAPYVGRHAMSVSLQNGSMPSSSGIITQGGSNHQETPAHVYADTSWSISFWLRVNGSIQKTKGQIILWRLVAPQDSEHDLRFGIDFAQNKVFGQTKSSAQPNESLSLANQVTMAGTWTHWTITFDMTQRQWQVYLNGRAITDAHDLESGQWWKTKKGQTQIYSHFLDVSNVSMPSSVEGDVDIGMDAFVAFLHGNRTTPKQPLTAHDIQHMYMTQRRVAAQGYFPISSLPSPPSSFFLFGDKPQSPSALTHIRPIVTTNSMYSQLFGLTLTSQAKYKLSWNTSVKPIVSHHVVPMFSFTDAGHQQLGQPVLETSSSPSTKGLYCRSHTYGVWIQASTNAANAWLPNNKTSKVTPFAVSLFRLYRKGTPYPDLSLILSPQEGYVYMQGNPTMNGSPDTVSRVPLNLALVFQSSSSSSWHHFMVVSDHKAKTNTLYVDGQSVGTDALKPAPWWCHYQNAYSHTVEMGEKLDLSNNVSDGAQQQQQQQQRQQKYSTTDAHIHISWDGFMFQSNVVYGETDVKSLYKHQQDTSPGSTHHLRATSMCRCLPGFYGDACEKGGKCLVTQMQKPNQKQPMVVYQLHEGFTQQQCEMMGIATQGSPHQRYPATNDKQQEPLLMFNSPGFLMFNRVSLQPLSIEHMFYWQPHNVFQWFRSTTFVHRLQGLFANTYQSNVPSSFFSLFTDKSLREQLNSSNAMQFVPILFTGFALGYTYGQDGNNNTKMSYARWLELSAILNLQVNCGSVIQVIGPPELRQDGYEFRSTSGWTYVKDLIADTGLTKTDLWDLWSELAAVYAFRGCIRSPLRDPESGQQLYTGRRSVPNTDHEQNVQPLAKMIYILYPTSNQMTYPSHTVDPARSIEIDSASMAFSTSSSQRKDIQVVDVAYPTFGGFHGTVIPSHVSHSRIQALTEELGNRDKCYNSPGTIYPWAWTVNTRNQYVSIAQNAINDSTTGTKGDDDSQSGDDSISLQKALQLGQHTDKQFPAINGQYPQYLADIMNAQCIDFKTKCIPVIDDRAMKVACDGGNHPNQRFDAYVYMTPSEAKNKGVINTTDKYTTGWYYVKNTTLQQNACDSMPTCSDLKRCRANVQLGTRLTHINRDQKLVNFAWRFQCPGSGSTLHSMEPCLQETRRIWWNWWTDTTKQLWGKMLVEKGATTSNKEPDFHQLQNIQTSNVDASTANAFIRRLNSQCDPGNPCQTLNANGDGFHFVKDSSGVPGTWKYGRKITSSVKCMHSNTIQRQKYCRTMRDHFCSLGLVYTGNTNGSCFCPLSFSETGTRAEQRMQLPYIVGVFSGQLKNDVQWASLQHGNQYTTKCRVSFSQDSWMHQQYYLAFNQLSSDTHSSPSGYVKFRNRISDTTQATITIWAQLPSNPTQQFQKTIHSVGLWYLEGSSSITTTTTTTNTADTWQEKSLWEDGQPNGLGLSYNVQKEQFQIHYQGKTYPVPKSAYLSNDAFWHHLALRVNDAKSSSNGNPSIDFFIDGKIQSSWKHIHIPGNDNPQPIHVGGELDGIDVSKWGTQDPKSHLGVATPGASDMSYIGGLHSFRVYTIPLSQDNIQNDMCQIRSPTITAGLQQAFQFNTGGGAILPSDPKPVTGSMEVDHDKHLACPPGYTFSTESNAGGKETYSTRLVNQQQRLQQQQQQSDKQYKSACTERKHSDSRLYSAIPCQHETPTWLYNRRCRHDWKPTYKDTDSSSDVGEQLFTFMIFAIVVSMVVSMVYGMNVDVHDTTQCWRKDFYRWQQTFR